MEDEHMDCPVCVAGSPGPLVSDNSIFFGLLRHCVRVRRSFGLNRGAAEMQKEPWLPQASGLRLQDTAPEEPCPPVPASPWSSLVRSLP